MSMMTQAPRRLSTQLNKAQADLFDGVRPIARRVLVQVIGDGQSAALELTDKESGRTQVWPLAKLRLVPDQARQDEMILAPGDTDPARLSLRDYDTLKAIFAAVPKLRPVRPQSGNWVRLGGMAAAAAAAFAAILFVLIPFTADRGAEMIPPEAEVAMGQSVFDQIYLANGARECTAPGGAAALSQMEARLTERLTLPYPLQVRVVTDPSINATALPGGHITIHQGLLDAAETPEEVAAVLAHEIGHVVHRDGTRAVLRSLGSFGIIGLLYGDFLGASATAGVTQQLLNASYSRAAEARADDFAHTLLARSGVAPTALGDFFRRLQARGLEMELGIFQHFSTHPELADRIAASVGAASGDVAATPILTVEEWAALQAICGQTAGGLTPSPAPGNAPKT